MTVPSSNQDELFNVGLIRSYVDKELNPRFVERHWLKQQIEEKLANPNCRFVLLTAEPGAGKSAFMAWLAYLNPQWSRYFIRRDQRTPLGDVGAHSLLLQIGFQLAAIYPDLFNQEQIEITVRQRIGQASDSEIVGAEIQRIIASPFRRKVVDIQQEVRESRKTQATGIRIGEIYSDVRLVPIDDLQGMALIDPAIALARTNPDQQIVILVDALDELSYRDINGTLIQWLATCPELPPNIRFILTARPNTPELEHFCETKRDQIQKLAIQEKDLRVIADSLNYVKQWVDRTPRIQTALQTKGHEIELFAQKAAEKADGNLGYLETIARAVDQADDEQINQFLDLSSLPGELEDLYGFFFRKIKDTVGQNTIRVEGDQPNQVYHYEAWLEVYRPILGVLAVAREPVTLQQIQQLGQIPCDWTYLVNAIGKLRQFLDQVDNSCYRLYHSTLPEFLTSEKAKVAYDYCYIDPVKQNQRVIQCYRGTAESWQEVNLEQIDDYGLRHLTQHLVQANLQQELHELLDLDKGGLNAWFEVKDSNGDVAGFLADVALAWSQAEGQFETSKKGELLGLQYRYALITASISNLTANIPSTLLAVLVKEGQWRSERALAYAQQIPDSSQKAKALKELAPHLTEPFRAQAYKVALKMDSWIREEILTDMIQYSPGTLLEILSSIESVELQSKTWHNLASCISGSLLQDAFAVIQEIENNDELRALALTALATRLPKLIPQALKVLPIIKDDQNRLKSLVSLIPYSQDEQLSETFEIAREFLATDSQIETLATFIIRLPNLLHIVIKKIQAKTQSKKPDAEFLILFSDLPDVLLGVLSELSKAIWEIQTDENFAQLLIAVIPKLPETSMAAAFTATQAINDGDYKLRVLSVLIPKLTGDLLSEAVQIVINMGGETDFENVILNSLSLPDNLVIKMLKAIGDYDRTRLEQKLLFSEQSDFFCKDFTAFQREQFLPSLAARIPDDLLQETIELVATFEQYKVRREILINLAPRLSDNLRLEAYKAINKIQDKDKQNMISLEENSLTPEILEAKQMVLLNAGLDSLIPDSLLIRSVELALISDEYNIQSKVESLVLLAPRLPDVLLLQAYRVANGTQSGGIQNNLFSEITDSSMREILKEVQLIQEEKLQVIALKHLIPFLPTSLLPEALEVIKSLRVGPRLETIVRFFIKGQVVAGFESLFKAFKNSINWRVNDWDAEPWTQVLTTAFPRLSNELWEDVLDEVEKVISPSKQLWVLFSLAPYMPKTLLPKVVKLARKAIPVGMAHRTTSFVVSFTAQFPDVAPDVFETKLDYASKFGIEKSDIIQISGSLILLPASLLPASFKAAKNIFSSNDVPIHELKRAVSFYLYKIFMPEALEAILAIQDRMEQDKIFAQLAPECALYLAPQAATKLSSVCWKDAVKLFLTQRDKKHLDVSLMELLKAVRAIQDELKQVEALNALAIHIPAAQSVALKTAGEIQNKKLRETVLHNLITNIPVNLLPEALATVLKIRDEGYQDQAMRLSFEIYLKALQSTIQSKSIYHLGILLQLVPSLGDILRIWFKKSFSRPQASQSQLYSEKPYLLLGRFLVTLVLYLLCVPLGLILLTSYTIDKFNTEKDSLVHKLKGFLPLIFRPFIPKRWLFNYLGIFYLDLKMKKNRIVGYLDYDQASRGLEQIVPYLPSFLMPSAWLIAGVMPNDLNRIRALRTLLPYVCDIHVPLALDLIKKIEDRQFRQEAFCALVDAISPVADSFLPQLLEIVQSLNELTLQEVSYLEQKTMGYEAEWYYTQAWIKLIPHLPPCALREAHEIAVSSTITNSIAMLKEIAVHLPFPEALAMIQTFNLLEDKVKTFRRLAEQLVDKPSTESYTLWKTSLHILAENSHERKELLTALEWLAPLVKDLGMKEGLSSTLQGIQRVVIWYP